LENTHIEYPSPSLIVIDETTDYGCEIVASRQHKGIEGHVGSSLMRKILREVSEAALQNKVFSEDHHTTSVTETSGKASIGAAKKPPRIFFAIHCPFPEAYGPHIVKACIDIQL
jgi:hypothetical protein